MKPESAFTVGVTGMNALPENPGPGLAVARCLRRAYGPRVRILGLGYDAFDPALYLEDCCDASYLLPYPSRGAGVLLGHLHDIHAHDPIDLLVPCLDAELPAFISAVPELSRMGIRTRLPEAGAFERRSKSRLPELCREAGVDCPEIHRVTNADFFRQCEREGWSYPLVVKGPFYDARLVHCAEEGIAAFRAIAAEWGVPVLAQRFVAGEEYNLAAVGDGEGNLLGEVMMKKRAVTSKGKAWAGISIFDAAFGEMAARLARELKWRGPLEIEAMRDAAGRYQLIEINPRFPSWIYLSQGVGRNLPALLAELALGRPAPQLAAPCPGTMFIRYAVETIVPLASFERIMVGGELSHAKEAA